MLRKAQFLTRATFILVLPVCGASPLSAEEQGGVHPYLDQTFFIDLGMYFPHREVTIARASGNRRDPD